MDGKEEKEGMMGTPSLDTEMPRVYAELQAISINLKVRYF